jgi:hypothetical protein
VHRWFAGALQTLGVRDNHRTSEAHQRAVKELNEQKGDALKLALANAASHQFDETCKVFQTAYYVAKRDRPYTDHLDIVTLQQQNGVDMGRILHSETVCKDIIDHIACEQRRS